MKDKEAEQLAICERWNATYMPTFEGQKVGIAENLKSGLYPINGLRHKPVGETSGWYIWAGEELSQDENFFQPLHAGHLSSWCPVVVKYLGLGPGWRFLIAPDYEDVWFDSSLLDN